MFFSMCFVSRYFRLISYRVIISFLDKTDSVMKKIIIGLLPALLALTVFDASAEYAGYIPYSGKSKASLAAEYDQNKDGYITADEVEVELREDAIEKAIKMQARGKSQKAVDQVIMNMEDSIEQDAEKIIDKMDTDGDELVEPEEIK